MQRNILRHVGALARQTSEDNKVQLGIGIAHVCSKDHFLGARGTRAGKLVGGLVPHGFPFL